MEALSSGFIMAALSFSMTSNLIHKDNDGLTWTLVFEGRILFSSHIYAHSQIHAYSLCALYKSMKQCMSCLLS